MRLTSLEYHEHVGDPYEWRLRETPLARINLLVGRNATGKSRTINVIASLALLLSGKRKEVAMSGSYRAKFDDGGVLVDYALEVDAGRVVKEWFTVDGTAMLTRGRGGLGQILYEDVEGRALKMKFNASDRELGVVAKRDSAQHSFLERMHGWGASVLHFEFGKGMGWANLAITVKVSTPTEVTPERDQIVLILNAATRKFGDGFTADVTRDMAELGYDLEYVKINQPANVLTLQQLPGDLAGVGAKERQLPCITDQTVMSQGMFRALSLLIQLQYALRCKSLSCVLIDDIGEGLDFERSCDLVNLLRAKSARENFQLILSTNDRFVMNAVPLEEWTVLQRDGNTVKARNHQNSRAAFERFEFTGLSNFDFFATDFLEEVEREAVGSD